MLTAQLESFAAAAVVAVLVAAVVRSRGIGMALPLVAVGALMSALPWGPDAPAAPELFLVLILAPLVFGEALSTSYLDVRKVSRPVLLLAVGLVVVSAFAVGAVAALVVPSMGFAVALCLGAILGPTDAVAVSATARKAGLPRRVVTILEGESLVNDGTALTLLRVAIVAAVAGGLTVGEVGKAAVESIVGGLLVGAVGGALLVVMLRRLNDTVAGNGIVLVAPFPLYQLAENVEGSGILAVVVAGLIVAHGTSSDPRFRGRLQVAAVWRQITFVLQAVAFMLVGIELPDTLRRLDAGEWRSLVVLVPVVAVVLAASRGLFVLGFLTTLRLRGRAPSSGWRAWLVIAWAGARGPISGLAAFSLPLTVAGGAPFPERDLVIAVTMCVIVVTLLLAPTLSPLARRLRLPPEDDDALVRRVRLSLARASLDRLEEIATEAERAGHPLPESAVVRLRESAVKRLDTASALVDGQEPAVAPDVSRRLAQQMIRAEMQELVRLRDDEGLPDELTRSMLADLEYRAGAVRRT